MVYYSAEMCIDTLRYILLLYNASVLLSRAFFYFCRNAAEARVVPLLFRQLAQVVQEPRRQQRQYRTKSVWRLCTPSACKFPVIFHKNAREYIKYSLRFLFHLTKNLTTHLSHNLCAVLPKIFLADCLYIFCESCYTDRGSTAPVPHAGFAWCCRKNCSVAMTGQHLKKRGEPFCLPN